MTTPVTRGEMHETLETWAGAIIARLTDAFEARFDARFDAFAAEMRALVKATEQTMIARMDAMMEPLYGVPERVTALEQAALPERVGVLEAKAFAPRTKRRPAARSTRRRR